ncbi:MAG TPA: helix-turn-helix domain-containing protein [Pseudonocardiaceae bacterium]|jgi:DNA-binding transcriptional ArsR family regulator|nr:helix-turn-helix domain-containing protein [Pseudonocardiaceae bacterium]
MARTLPQPTIDSITMTTVLAALADPVRRSLMRALYLNAGPVDCAIAAETVEVSAPTVSHHWRVLREAGLTTTVVNGRRRTISVREDDLEIRFPGLLKAVLDPDDEPAQA